MGKDVAMALGYSNTRDALSRHVDVEDKGVVNHDTPSGIQKMTIINESGLYSLILSSKLESAKRFKRWVTSEVLPCIRKHGGYLENYFYLVSFIICSILMISRIIEGGNIYEKEAQKNHLSFF